MEDWMHGKKLVTQLKLAEKSKLLSFNLGSEIGLKEYSKSRIIAGGRGHD